MGFIGNMDETLLWMDMAEETTVTHRGEHSLRIRTTGHEKNRFTVCLCAMANGRKLKPYVVFKGVRSIPELQNASGVMASSARNGWMNEELTKDWAKCCWGTLGFGRRLLVWDAYKCHLTTDIREVVNKVTRSDVAIVPGGLTSLVQPADVCLNKPFKEKYKELYGEWVSTGQKSAGNIRAPNKLQCLEWMQFQ